MKKLKQMGGASVVVLMLSIPAIAGDIGIPNAPPPPPAPLSTAPGEIGIPGASQGDAGIFGGTQGPSSPNSPFTDVTLGLLQTLLSIF